MNTQIGRGSIAVLAVGLLLVGGCARSPEAKKARALERGERYFQKEQYREAIVEYLNAFRIDQTEARAIQRIGLAHYRLGEVAQAVRFLLRAEQLTPDDLEVRLALGTIYLRASRPEEAGQEAAFILSKDPRNLDALVLLAGAADTPDEIASTIQRLEGLRADLGGQARFHVALANLYLRKRDLPSTERALREAVAKDPKSPEAHLALGNFFTVKGERAEAEKALKTAADLAPAGSPARIRLADFYLHVRQPDDAKRILSEVTDKAPDYLPAWRRLAEIALGERQYPEAQRAIDAVLKKSPGDLEGRLLRGRLHLAQRETTQAIQVLQEVLKLEPRLAPARLQLAIAHLQDGNIQQAKNELREATTISPNYLEAGALLAELNIRTRAFDPAIDDLQKLIASHPRVVGLHLLLGSAYLAKREPEKAVEAYRKLVAVAPKDPRGHHFVGVALRAQGKAAEARREFETAVALAPAFVDPLAQMVAIDLADRRPDAALERVRRQIALAPESAAHQQLLGRVHQVRKEPGPAETAFLRAVDLDPRLMGPYLDLARLYAASGRREQAVAKANDALKVNPQNIGALMLTGILHDQGGEVSKARDAYERALAVNPRFGPAANNLAYLYSEHGGGDQERALQLAQTAREVLPTDPHVADTLGWILYKRGVYQRALGLIQESASKLPDNPEVQYHLGMTASKAGDRELARRALTQAINSRVDRPWKDAARKALADLQ